MKHVRSLSPKLPLVYDPSQGYGMNTGFVELVIQNFKMLLLTIPGERIMDPSFGVGLKTYLFEPNVQRVHGDIHARIVRQAEKYIPAIQINSINFFTSENSIDIPDNYLHITVDFFIKPIERQSSLDLFFNSAQGVFTEGIV